MANIKNKLGDRLSKGLIVGLDPGITTGLAILDVYGRVLLIWSRRDVKKNELLRPITKFGKPFVVACDVNPPPKTVEKVASSLGSKLFYPETDLSVAEKNEMVKKYERKIRNDHEKDALASAIKAYNNYKDLFERIEKHLSDLGHIELFDEVAMKVLKEGTENIVNVTNEIIEQKRKPEPEIEIKKRMTEEEYKELVEKLKNKLMIKDSDLKFLREYSESLKRTVEELRNEIRKLRSAEIVDREIERLWHRISLLENQISEMRRTNEFLKKLKRIEEEGLIPLVEIENTDSQSLIEINRKIDLKNRIVFTNSIELTGLNEYGIRALVRKTPLSESEIEKLEFPVIILSEEQIEKFEEIKTIKEELFEKEVKEARKTGLVEWLKRYRKRKI